MSGASKNSSVFSTSRIEKIGHFQYFLGFLEDMPLPMTMRGCTHAITGPDAALPIQELPRWSLRQEEYTLISHPLRNCHNLLLLVESNLMRNEHSFYIIYMNKKSYYFSNRGRQWVPFILKFLKFEKGREYNSIFVQRNNRKNLFETKNIHGWSIRVEVKRKIQDLL